MGRKLRAKHVKGARSSTYVSVKPCMKRPHTTYLTNLEKEEVNQELTDETDSTPAKRVCRPRYTYDQASMYIYYTYIYIYDVSIECIS